MYKYFVIFPSDDRSKLEILELAECSAYKIMDYARASRKDFDDEDEAISYGKQLAKENNLQFVGSSDGYLD